MPRKSRPDATSSPISGGSTTADDANQRSDTGDPTRSTTVTSSQPWQRKKNHQSAVRNSRSSPNQVERFFAYVTADLLQRSDHRSVHALEGDIRAWVTAWNENPKPFIWTKTAEQTLESLKRLLQRTNDAGH